MPAPKKIIRGTRRTSPPAFGCHLSCLPPAVHALAAQHRPETYRVDVYDRGTPIDGDTAEGFDRCLALVRVYEARYPGMDVRPSNPDRADEDDGLTRAERDAIEEVRGG